jgi:hypothetical protein
MGQDFRGRRARWALSMFITGVLFPVMVRIGSNATMALRSLPVGIVFVGIGSVLWFTRGRS